MSYEVRSMLCCHEEKVQVTIAENGFLLVNVDINSHMMSQGRIQNCQRGDSGICDPLGAMCRPLSSPFSEVTTPSIDTTDKTMCREGRK